METAYRVSAEEADASLEEDIGEVRSHDSLEVTRYVNIFNNPHSTAEDRNAAFTYLFEQFQMVVFAIVLLRLHNRTEAHEITQEVFLQVQRKLSQIEDPRCFAGWIKQIAVRMAVNHSMRTHKMGSLYDENLASKAHHPSKLPAETPGPLAVIMQREQRGLLYELLSELGDIDRRTLISFYLNEGSLKDLAEEFEAPIGTIKRRLHTARNRLRELFVKRGY